jgi:hypothetical protein
MRLWSLHPCHLDRQGLLALWREGLLGRAVLLGRTRGYRSHPQLVRFAARHDPVAALDCYLSAVLDEATLRGYRFDAGKLDSRETCRCRARVTTGQLDHEWRHLLAKLAVRDPDRLRAEQDRSPLPHPCFSVVPGPVESWERPGRR